MIEVAVIGWVIVVIAWLGMEAMGLWGPWKGKEWPTFTNLIHRYVPRWIIAAFLGWLAWHFLIEN